MNDLPEEMPLGQSGGLIASSLMTYELEQLEKYGNKTNTWRPVIKNVSN